MENKELRNAWEFAEHTGISIFLTGKAGTGKTTFLRTLKEHSSKRMIVVAPTGVAAINAGGVTIHSFFQLPLSPYVPGTTLARRKGASSARSTCWSSTRSPWCAVICSMPSTMCCGAIAIRHYPLAVCSC